MSALLSVTGLEAAYGPVKALHSIDFEVREGGVTALLGANGAGKTTTLRAICRMVKTRGDILFDGKPIMRKATEDVVRLSIAHVPEGRGTFTTLSVEENLHLGAMTRARAGIAADVQRMYGYFPRLEERRTQQAGSLSGGERRRVEITRALVLDPKFLMLDEPFAGVDPIAVIEIQKIIEQLKERGIGVIVTDHNVRETLRICDRAYIIKDGEILKLGTPEVIAEDPQVREVYLGEHFRLH